MSKGFIFKCSNSTESECLERALFGADQLARDEVLQLEPGDALYLLNVETDTLSGVYEATAKGGVNLIAEAWRGRYPFQVSVRPVGPVKKLSHAKATLEALGMRSHRFLSTDEVDALNRLLTDGHLPLPQDTRTPPKEMVLELQRRLDAARKAGRVNDPEDEKPPLESTTLWDYPTQSYGRTPKGNNRYAGVTPAFIIYNMVKRYTMPGDLVLDPMCGSGTTIDVCREEGRRVIGYDIVSVRPDIQENDARSLPLPDNSVDMVFIDSPYGDNIKYNTSPKSFGAISAEREEFYDELEKAMKEAYRVLKPGKVLGWLIGDQWVKKRFTPVGFKVYERLTRYFEPVDIICVARRNQTSNTGVWHNRALRFNFYLRGFKYLIIVRKPDEETRKACRRGGVRWAAYARDWGNGPAEVHDGLQRSHSAVQKVEGTEGT